MAQGPTKSRNRSCVVKSMDIEIVNLIANLGVTDV